MPDIGVGNDGWDFLSRPTGDDGESYSDDDGGWGYREADGSGSFYGADGSWGYRNADGSGSYFGDDGTWGYWESDGSFSYYGADGGWGYSDSDGNGSFHGTDGSYSWWDSDGSYRITDRSGNSRYETEDDGLTYIDLSNGVVEGEDDGQDSLVSRLVSAAILTAFGVKAPPDDDDEVDDEDEAYVYSSPSSWRSSSTSRETERLVEKARQEEERRRREQEARERALRRRAATRAYLKEHWRGCVKATLVFFLTLLLGMAYHEYGLLTPIGYGSSDLEGKMVGEIHGILKDAGFSRITDEALCDLSASDADNANLVSRVKLVGPDEFPNSWLYPSNFPITIEYHSFKLVRTPMSAREARGEPYEDIAAQFESAGFESVQVEPARDLILGVLHKEGTVAIISIDGNRKFASDETFEVCDTVQIRYHSSTFG